jgi:hypothetical protein
MKARILVAALCCMTFVGCGNSEKDKAQAEAQRAQEEAQRAYDARAAKSRAVWDANPGGELAALECGQLADASEKNQAQYTRIEVYQTCMRNKGFGNLFK